jgi:uncharacterized repeat protein (TIGR01451 family)
VASHQVPRLARAVGASLVLIVAQAALVGSVAAATGPDLTVAKTLVGSMVSGSPATYQIVATNVGTSPMPGPITVTDTLSTALTYTSATGTGWTCSAAGQVVTCTTPGPLAASASLPPITLTVMVGGAGTVVPAVIPNCASVTGGAGATGAPEDVNPQNDRSCIESPVVKAGTLCIVKFNDLDGDGVRDPGEPLLANWTFTITAPDGTNHPVTTDADGRICRDVPPGAYTVTETTQAGWTLTAPVPVGPQIAIVTSGQTTTIVFGNHQTPTQPGTVCIVKFNDLDGDGKQDPGEPFLAGWTFTITAADGTVLTLTTNADGRACKDLPAGTYTVAEVLQAGWVQTAPVPVGTQTVTIVAGQTTTIVFGNHQNACCLTFVFQHGKKDNFSLSNGAKGEPVIPAPAPPTTTQLYFDGTEVNRLFSDKLSLPTGNCISSATFEIRMKPLRDVPGNDSIVLKIPGTGGATWSKSINSLSLATPPAYAWNPGKPAKTYTWNMGAMPLGGVNLLPSLDALRVLAVYVQDDTSVDYITLTVTFCPCQATTLPAVTTQSAAQSMPSTPAAAAPCDCLPASPRR